VLKDEHMSQKRKYALIVAATVPLLALGSYASVVVCSSKAERVPKTNINRIDLQYFPPGHQSQLWNKDAMAQAGLDEFIDRHLKRSHGSEQPDAEPEIQLTDAVADENTETTADIQEPSSESEPSDDDPDGIDRWFRSDKYRQILRNLGID
jgi:hypothetical protein